MHYPASSAPVVKTQLVDCYDQLPQFNPRWALFLDFDGTLADIAPNPSLANLQPSIKAAVIAKRARLSGALALVSGRTIADLDAYFCPYRLSAAGMHGAEMRLPEGESVELSNGNCNVFSIVAARLVAILKHKQGVVIEHKPLAVTLHYRAAPAQAIACLKAVRTAINEFDEIEVRPGKMVLEIGYRTVKKGFAVERFMTHSVFKGRIPVFIGDDFADESAINVAQQLGGFGVRILDQADQTPTCAMYATHDASVVREWLLAL